MHLPVSTWTKPRTSWCGYPLQSGVKIIGFLSLFSNLVGATLRVIQWTFIDFEKPSDGLDTLYNFICIATAIVSFVVVLCAIGLLDAAYNSRRWLLIPWLFSDLLLRIILLCNFTHSVCLVISPTQQQTSSMFPIVIQQDGPLLTSLATREFYDVNRDPFYPLLESPPTKTEAIELLKQFLQTMAPKRPTTSKPHQVSDDYFGLEWMWRADTEPEDRPRRSTVQQTWGLVRWLFKPHIKSLQIFFAAVSAVAVVVGIYLWCIVFSYFLELKERETAKLRADCMPLHQMFA